MFRVALAVAAVATLVLPATSHAVWDLATDGNPKITTNGFSEGAISACSPSGVCTPIPMEGRMGVYEAGETAVGTTFEVSSHGWTERSPAWQGRVTVIAPPTISGKVVAGEHVSPGAGAWTGGWGDDLSSLSLSACATPEGAGCVSLPEAGYCAVPCRATPADGGLGSKDGLGAIPPVLAGRYLIATDTRLARDQRFAPLGLLTPWTLNSTHDLAGLSDRKPTARSAPVKIAPLPEPTASLRARALRYKGQLRVGRITCTYVCNVSVKVSGGGKKASTTTFMVTGAKALAVPVRRGKLTVRIHADGKLLTTGKITAR